MCIGPANASNIAVSALELNDLPYAEGVQFSSTPHCLSGTRQGILERIRLALIGAEDEGPRIILLTGVAGYGKSAVASTIAEWFEARKRLGSSYFFDRNDDNRNRVDNVFTTMARDIADSNPQFKDILWKAVKDSRSLRKTANVVEQFTQFILKPAQRLTTIGPIIIVFDGLDECADPATRKTFIRVLAEEFPKLPANFRLFITARPDDDILRGLTSGPFSRHIRMEDIETHSTRADLSAYVVEQLAPISAVLEAHWPQMQWRDQLVNKAECLFIWISTACRFIMNEGKVGINHVNRLRTVLSEAPQALAPLDTLYIRVLRSILDEQDTDAMTQFKAVMGTILAVKVPLSTIALSDILAADKSVYDADHRPSVQSVIPYLGAMLIGSADHGRPIQFLHLSFKDFLTTPSRSETFFIDVKPHSRSMALLCLDFMHEHLMYDLIKTGDSTRHNPDLEQVRSSMEKYEAVRCVCRYWVDHVIDVDACDELLYARICRFFRHDVLSWIEALSLTNQLEYAPASLDRLGRWLQVRTILDRYHGIRSDLKSGTAKWRH